MSVRSPNQMKLAPTLGAVFRTVSTTSSASRMDDESTIRSPVGSTSRLKHAITPESASAESFKEYARNLETELRTELDAYRRSKEMEFRRRVRARTLKVELAELLVQRLSEVGSVPEASVLEQCLISMEARVLQRLESQMAWERDRVSDLNDAADEMDAVRAEFADYMHELLNDYRFNTECLILQNEDLERSVLNTLNETDCCNVSASDIQERVSALVLPVLSEGVTTISKLAHDSSVESTFVTDLESSLSQLISKHVSELQRDLGYLGGQGDLSSRMRRYRRTLICVRKRIFDLSLYRQSVLKEARVEIAEELEAYALPLLSRYWDAKLHAVKFDVRKFQRVSEPEVRKLEVLRTQIRDIWNKVPRPERVQCVRTLMRLAPTPELAFFINQRLK